jgi:hypothetical protein
MISPSPVKVFFGWCLMAVGGLIALTCGLCTFGFVVVGVIGAFGRYGGGPFSMISSLLAALMFGGLPTLVGAGVFIAGREMTLKREPGVAR